MNIRNEYEVAEKYTTLYMKGANACTEAVRAASERQVKDRPGE